MRLVADPSPASRPWFNPGDPGWRPAQVYPVGSFTLPPTSQRVVSRGWRWRCPNHPEHRSGVITGQSRYSHQWCPRRAEFGYFPVRWETALARLALHFEKYHR